MFPQEEVTLRELIKSEGTDTLVEANDEILLSLEKEGFVKIRGICLSGTKNVDITPLGRCRCAHLTAI